MENINGTRNRDIPLLKASDVARYLNISRSLAYQLLQCGDIPSVRINSLVRVRPSDLDEYIQNCLTSSKEGI